MEISESAFLHQGKVPGNVSIWKGFKSLLLMDCVLQLEKSCGIGSKGSEIYIPT